MKNKAKIKKTCLGVEVLLELIKTTFSVCIKQGTLQIYIILNWNCINIPEHCQQY